MLQHSQVNVGADEHKRNRAHFLFELGLHRIEHFWINWPIEPVDRNILGLHGDNALDERVNLFKRILIHGQKDYQRPSVVWLSIDNWVTGNAQTLPAVHHNAADLALFASASLSAGSQIASPTTPGAGITPMRKAKIAGAG